MARVWIGVVLLLGIGAGPPPAVTIRGVRPDQQGERLIALFQGSRAPHPAAALSAWKRARGDRSGLGKPAEAAVAALNPATVRELRTLDGAEVALRLDPGDGRLRWRAVLPRDDGTFAAVATAMALTDGGSDPPLDGIAVDRLGPPGAPLMARFPGGLALAGSRAELVEARDRPRFAWDGPTPDSGWFVQLDPDALGATGPLALRRAGEALRALHCAGVDGVARLRGETFSVALTARLDARRDPAPPIDPRWLDWIPATGTVAALALAIDPKPDAWDALFALADCVERADPARAAVAPVRTRLNLLATAAGVRPEVDLWPALRGLTQGVSTDEEGTLHSGFLALHVENKADAEQLAGRVLPRITGSILKTKPTAVARRGTTVLLVWGAVTLQSCIDAAADPERSAAPLIRAAWGDEVPQRAGAFWPGRLRALAPPGSPAASALAEAPPVVWLGRDDAKTARETVEWTGLRGVVRRFLETLPLDPPPDRSD
jgi:hypothetical protein